MAAVIGIFEEQYKRGLPITVVKPGNQKRDFTHVSDIVRGTYLAWKKNLNEEFMLGTKKNHTLLEVAEFFGSEIKFLPVRRGERFESIVKNNKAQELLGYRAEVNLKDYISDFKQKNKKKI